jgi:hypothetical protein
MHFDEEIRWIAAVLEVQWLFWFNPRLAGRLWSNAVVRFVEFEPPLGRGIDVDSFAA